MGRVKELIKVVLPTSLVDRISAARMAAWQRRWKRMGQQERFDYIHRENRWGNRESVSGCGSTLEATERIRAALPGLLAEFEIRSMLDIPCGDFHWMQMLDLDVDYIGADIVRELIEQNQENCTSERCRFVHLNLIEDTLPHVDAVFCRECLVHFCHAEVKLAVANIARSGSEYLITSTYTDLAENVNIETGDWRPIDFTKAPFNWPEPLQLVNDASSPEAPPPDKNKSIGVWRIADLPL